MVTRFEEGKKYKFDIKAFKNDIGIENAKLNERWANDCIDKIIESVNDRGIGKIDIFEIEPRWCIEIDTKQEILDNMKTALDLLRKIDFDLKELNEIEQFDTNTSSKLYIFYDIKSVLSRIEKTIEA